MGLEEWHREADMTATIPTPPPSHHVTSELLYIQISFDILLLCQTILKQRRVELDRIEVPSCLLLFTVNYFIAR